MYLNKIALTALFFLGFILINCEGDEGTCPPVKGYYFDINGISTLVHYAQAGTNSIQAISDNSIISFSLYRGISLQFATAYLSELNRSQKRVGSGQLYALSCVQNGEGGAKTERFQSINVITLYDFNDQFQEGDTINDLLTLHGNETIEEFLEARDTLNVESTSLWFTLTEQPTAQPDFKVKVIVTLSNGEVYEKQTTTVVFE